MGENENIEKDIQNIETATEKDKIPDTKIGELDCESLDKVSGGQSIVSNPLDYMDYIINPNPNLIRTKPAYGFTSPVIIEPDYGFQNDPSNRLKILKKQLEDELRKPNLSEEEKNRIKKRLDVILKQLGGISGGSRQ